MKKYLILLALLFFPLRASATIDFTASTTPTNVAPYGLSATVGVADQLGGLDGAGYMIQTGHLDRIRQTGDIIRIKIYTGDITNLSSLQLRIYRKDGSTYDIVSTSDNLISLITSSTLQTVTLPTPIAAAEGDYIGAKVITTGTGADILYETPLTAGHGYRISTDAGADADNYDWDSVELIPNALIVIECEMIAPQVIFMGDSIISGSPANASFVMATNVTNLSTTLPYHFGQKSGMTYQNLGIGSTGTNDFVNELATFLVAKHPRLLVIDGGTNDLGARTKAEWLANWNTILTTANTNDIYTVVLSIMPKGAVNATMITRDDWNQTLRDLVVSTYPKAVFVDTDPYVGLYRAGGTRGNLWDQQPLYYADAAVHYNSAGHDRLAQAAYDGFLRFNHINTPNYIPYTANKWLSKENYTDPSLENWEVGEIADDWTIDRGMKTTDKHSGNYAAEVNGYAYQIINTTPEHPILLDSWAKVANVGNYFITLKYSSDEVENNWYNFTGDNAGTWVSGDPSPPAEAYYLFSDVTTTYAQFTYPGTITAPSDQNRQVQIYFNNGEEGGSLYIDDISVVDTVSSTELISNGGFENWTSFDYLTSWVNSSFLSETTLSSLEKESTIVHSGSYSAKLTTGASDTTPSQHFIGQELFDGSTNFDKFNLSFWSRNNNAPGQIFLVDSLTSTTPYAYNFSGINAGTWTILESPTAENVYEIPSTTTWTKTTLFNLPASPTKILSAVFTSPANIGESCYFDDLSLKIYQ